MLVFAVKSTPWNEWNTAKRCKINNKNISSVLEKPPKNLFQNQFLPDLGFIQLKVESNDSVCGLVSVQPPFCPISYSGKLRELLVEFNEFSVAD